MDGRWRCQLRDCFRLLGGPAEQDPSNRSTRNILEIAVSTTEKSRLAAASAVSPQVQQGRGLVAFACYARQSGKEQRERKAGVFHDKKKSQHRDEKRGFCFEQDLFRMKKSNVSEEQVAAPVRRGSRNRVAKMIPDHIDPFSLRKRRKPRKVTLIFTSPVSSTCDNDQKTESGAVENLSSASSPCLSGPPPKQDVPPRKRSGLRVLFPRRNMKLRLRITPPRLQQH